MNLKLKALMAAGFFIGALSYCTHKPTVEEKSQAKGQWQAKMMVLSQTLSRLLPLTASPRTFNDLKNDGEITKDIKELASMAHAVDEMKVKPSDDPSLTFMAERFSENMNEAVQQIDRGNRRYARFLVRQSTAYCIGCHTRTDQGRENMKLSSAANLTGLSTLERADYFIAVRDYDRALNEFDKLINSPDAQIESPQTLEVAAEKALAVAVRVKKNPNLAKELVARIIDAKWAPVYLRMNALAWKRTIEDWEKNEPKSKLSSKGQLRMAKDFLNRGWKKTSNSPQSQAGLVYFLRASTVLHDLLGRSSSDPNYADALYYAGLAAESLRDINLWTLHEAYYESCIRTKPYTQLAKKCYLRLEALQLSAYSTYEGTFVPAQVRDRLRELRSMADKGDGKFLDWGFVE